MVPENPTEQVARLAEGLGAWIAGTNPPDTLINDVLTELRQELREPVRAAALAVAERIRKEKDRSRE